MGFGTSRILAWGACLAQAAVGQSFTRLQIDPQFYSEAIQVGDINRDGNPDIVSGPFWYAGPAFTQKTSFRTPPSPWPTTGDSDCYGIFVQDFNGDGWPDILSFRVTGGSQAVWYENPQGASGNWTERVVFSSVHSESPAFTDVTGDGKPEIVTISARFGGWARPDASNPNAVWSFRGVTTQGPTTWSQYAHGTGAGDVNGDGRVDLLFPEGWWEQPVDSAAALWTHHPVAFWGQALSGEGYGGAQMHVYDVDGDGDNDVVTSLQAHGWGLAWFENQSGSFTQRLVMNTRADTALYGAAAPQLHSVALADMNGDGLKDIVTGKRRGTHGNGLGSAELNAPATLYVFRLVRAQGQAPRFVPQLLDTVAGVGTQITVADVNKDGAPDILTASRQGAYVFLNQTPNSVRRGRGPGFTPPFRGDFLPVRDASGRLRDEESCRECVVPGR